MDIRLRGRSRTNGKDLFYHNEIAELYHSVNNGSLMGFAGYDQLTESQILLDIEMFTGFRRPLNNNHQRCPVRCITPSA